MTDLHKSIRDSYFNGITYGKIMPSIWPDLIYSVLIVIFLVNTTFSLINNIFHFYNSSYIEKAFTCCEVVVICVYLISVVIAKAKMSRFLFESWKLFIVIGLLTTAGILSGPNLTWKKLLISVGIIICLTIFEILLLRYDRKFADYYSTQLLMLGLSSDEHIPWDCRIQKNELVKLYSILCGINSEITVSKLENLKQIYQSEAEKIDKKYSHIKATTGVMASISVFLNLFQKLFPEHFDQYQFWASRNTGPIASGFLLIIILVLYIIIFNTLIGMVQEYHKKETQLPYRKNSLMVDSINLLILRLNFTTGEIESSVLQDEWIDVKEDYWEKLQQFQEKYK